MIANFSAHSRWLKALLLGAICAGCATADATRRPWSVDNTPLAIAGYEALSDSELFETANAALSGDAIFNNKSYIYFAAARRARQNGDRNAERYWLQAASYAPVVWGICQTIVSPDGTVGCAPRTQRLRGLPEAQFALGCLLSAESSYSDQSAALWFMTASSSGYPPARRVTGGEAVGEVCQEASL